MNDNHVTIEFSSSELAFFNSLMNYIHLRQLWIDYTPLVEIFQFLLEIPQVRLTTSVLVAVKLVVISLVKLKI